MDSELQGNHSYNHDALQRFSSAPRWDRLIYGNVRHFHIGSVFKIDVVEYKRVSVGLQRLHPDLHVVAILYQYYLICKYELTVGHLTVY